MKKLAAITSAVFMASAMSTAAIADNISDDFRAAEASYQALSAQLETMGYEAGELDLGYAMTPSQKLDAVKEQNKELQGVFDDLHKAN
ncbi:hypothetical protein MAQ5080_01697 [Marinomonas aquimarina]|uniref:Uncharacterized protein n=1 Tax=Marinomonas aquimarina TaxID=295068 RepID=A0A1A8TF82_9GAMM|nr:hypothetical protein [Marinomonas aquimarina]SBS30531.1 hypothetical protein MAQ5080_01697 [Marinomonas aquimarina]